MTLMLRFELGVLAAILASFGSTLGGQLRIRALTHEGRATLCLQIFGWTFWLAGQAMGQVAILLAPATVAACVTFSSSLLCNALLAPLVLHEKLTRLHGVGIVLLSVGGAAVTLSSASTEHKYSSWPQMIALPQTRAAMGLGAGCVAVALGLLAHAYAKQALDIWSFAYLFALCGSTDLLVTKFTLQLVQLQVVSHDPSLLPPGSVTSGFVVLMITMHIATFGFQVLSVYYRKALQSLPLFLGSGAIMQISLSGVVFQEFDFTGLQAATFLLGFSLVLLGLVVTSLAAPALRDEEASSIGEAESPQMKSELSGPNHVFRPPTAISCDSFDEPSISQRPSSGNLPTKSSGLKAQLNGLLPRSNSSMSSADLVFLGEIQRSAMCFGSHSTTEGAISLDRKFESMPVLRRPLLRSISSPMRSAPALVGTANGCMDGESVVSSGGGSHGPQPPHPATSVWRSLDQAQIDPAS